MIIEFFLNFNANNFTKYGVATVANRVLPANEKIQHWEADNEAIELITFANVENCFIWFKIVELLKKKINY